MEEFEEQLDEPRNGARDDLFARTRLTLLQRVNSGDAAAFEEFYNLYCPAMLNYLRGFDQAKVEQDRWDIVQTVFVNFYKSFALVEDPDSGERRIPRSLMETFVRTDSETGKTNVIKFRQYLKTCLKNAMRSKWRQETKRGRMRVYSIDTQVKPEDPRTWKDLLESEGVNPDFLDCSDEEGTRLAAVWGIWQAVIKGFLLDESLDERVRDIVYRSIAEGVSTDDLAKHWGITKNYAYVIKCRGKEKAERITKRIFEMIEGEGLDVAREADRLYKAVSTLRPSRKVDKFMIELAKDLCKEQS